jgi:hypothetical protein
MMGTGARGSFLRILPIVAESFSSVNIRVGTPPQWVSVFPSTTGEETWVIGRGGCDGCMCFIPLQTLGLRSAVFMGRRFVS